MGISEGTRKEGELGIWESPVFRVVAGPDAVRIGERSMMTRSIRAVRMTRMAMATDRSSPGSLAGSGMSPNDDGNGNGADK